MQWLMDTAKFAAEVPEDSRVLRLRCLWFPTSDRFETWLIPCKTTQSGQFHESGNHGLTHPALVTPLLVLCLVFSNKKCVMKQKQAL